jgi:hypothetical protein
MVLVDMVLAMVDAPHLSVLEPACGSANHYRFLVRCGIARFLDYAGFDLCAKNLENARALFPEVRFGVGNVFAITEPGQSCIRAINDVGMTEIWTVATSDRAVRQEDEFLHCANSR